MLERNSSILQSCNALHLTEVLHTKLAPCRSDAIRLCPKGIWPLKYLSCNISLSMTRCGRSPSTKISTASSEPSLPVPRFSFFVIKLYAESLSRLCDSLLHVEYLQLFLNYGKDLSQTSRIQVHYASAPLLRDVLERPDADLQRSLDFLRPFVTFGSVTWTNANTPQ